MEMLLNSPNRPVAWYLRLHEVKKDTPFSAKMSFILECVCALWLANRFCFIRGINYVVSKRDCSRKGGITLIVCANLFLHAASIIILRLRVSCPWHHFTLHPTPSAHAPPYPTRIFACSLRGHLKDIFSLGEANIYTVSESPDGIVRKTAN